MNSNINEIRIVVVDGAQANNGTGLMGINGNAESPDLTNKISGNMTNPLASFNPLKRQAMPLLNQATGGMAGKINSITRFGKTLSNAFSAGGAVLVGGIAAIELTKFIISKIKEEQEKANQENIANLLKIRSGQIQMGAGVYQSKTNVFGKVKYNSN